jgi:hypothetical protein
MSHGFLQEMILARRTDAVGVQSSDGRKVKSPKMRWLINRAIGEPGEGNFHSKADVFFENVSGNCQIARGAARCEVIFFVERIHQSTVYNLINEIAAVENTLKCQQVHRVTPGHAPDNNEHEFPRLNSRADLQGDFLGETIAISISHSYSSINQL